MYDIVVVGAGTAGLSAAIYGVRAGKSVLVLEGASYGGQIINTGSFAFKTSASKFALVIVFTAITFPLRFFLK